MIQNRSSESQNDHQWAKKDDGPKANPCNELLRLSAASKVNLSLLGINKGGCYPLPSLARISAALICPTLVIIDVPLNLTRIIPSLPLLWSSREDAILNQGTSQSSSWWAAEPPGERHTEMLSQQNIHSSIKLLCWKWDLYVRPLSIHSISQLNVTAFCCKVPSLHSSRYFIHFQASIKHWQSLAHPCLNILHPTHISLGNSTGGGLALL